MSVDAKGKVFLSYSRRDAAFADEIKISLESHGYGATIDQEDLFPGYSWEERLHVLIRDADSIAYLVSSASLSSVECIKELGVAREEGKRIIPLVIGQVDYGGLPVELRELQFIFLVGEGKTFAKGMAALIEALGTDIEWVNKHSAFSQAARRWRELGGPRSNLLRGVELKQARKWLKDASAPFGMRISPQTSEFIDASSAQATRSRGWTVFLTTAFIGVVIWAGTAHYLWQRSTTAEAQVEGLQQQIVARPTTSTGALSARQADQVTLDLLIQSLLSENRGLRHQTRGDITHLLRDRNDAVLNRALIRSVRERASAGGNQYRLYLGAGVALSNLSPTAPMDDRTAALTDLRVMYCAVEHDRQGREALMGATRIVSQDPQAPPPSCGS